MDELKAGLKNERKTPKKVGTKGNLVAKEAENSVTIATPTNDTPKYGIPNASGYKNLFDLTNTPKINQKESKPDLTLGKRSSEPIKKKRRAISSDEDSNGDCDHGDQAVDNYGNMQVQHIC